MSAPALRLLLLLLAASACGTFQAYPGSRRAPDQVAVISAGRGDPGTVVLDSVNGLRLGALQGTAELLPGPQQLRAVLHFRRGARTRAARRELRFEALPGARYTAHADWFLYGPRLTVRNQDGEIVAEARTPLPPVGAAPAR